MAQRYRMWLRKSKLLTRNMKGEKAEAHTSLRIYNEVGSDITRPWLYENYLGSTGTPVVNVTKATISAKCFEQVPPQQKDAFAQRHVGSIILSPWLIRITKNL
ncbi:hypothetical protein DY000_02006254 [Brassica cretica]|uniref:Uncharacterized protein n=1 Tax=Brassica cretica TaxID=69181 RepID=A0ABQ7C2W3_BRACR|nr:hypothetical protein DY000_02006254 [Brassica cretica]